MTTKTLNCRNEFVVVDIVLLPVELLEETATFETPP